MEKAINWMLWHSPNFAIGTMVAAASSYFQPIKGIVAVTMIAIIVDLVLGIWAARRQGKGIRSDKLWRTIYKMLISFTILHLLYSVDKEFGIIKPHSYIIAGLFIIGFEIWSIFENAAIITDHKAFRILRKYMTDKVKSSTGVDLEEYNNKNEEEDRKNEKGSTNK